MHVRSTALELWCIEICPVTDTGFRLVQGPAKTGFTVQVMYMHAVYTQDTLVNCRHAVSPLMQSLASLLHPRNRLPVSSHRVRSVDKTNKSYGIHVATIIGGSGSGGSNGGMFERRPTPIIVQVYASLIGRGEGRGERGEGRGERGEGRGERGEGRGGEGRGGRVRGGGGRVRGGGGE